MTSPSASMIWVRRSSPYLLISSVSSSLMMLRISRLLERICLRWAMSFSSSAASETIFSCSRPVSLCSLMSKMAFACSSERRNASIRPSLASAGVGAALMILITSSMFFRAMSRPARIWALFSAASSSKRVRLSTTMER